jgi:hypothetical protein
MPLKIRGGVGDCLRIHNYWLLLKNHYWWAGQNTTVPVCEMAGTRQTGDRERERERERERGSWFLGDPSAVWYRCRSGWYGANVNTRSQRAVFPRSKYIYLVHARVKISSGSKLARTHLSSSLQSHRCRLSNRSMCQGVIGSAQLKCTGSYHIKIFK